MNPAIQTQSLTKQYQQRLAVDGLDWHVESGTAWGLLGHNGAGKSTTIKMLMGFTLPSRGSATVFSEDPVTMAPQTRARIGYVAELPVLPPWAKVGDLVQFHSSLYPRWDDKRFAELRKQLDVADNARVATLSKGQNRRLMLLLALCQGSELLILDEPASGLDVAARRALLEELGDFLAQDGRTLVLSSHIVTDVERIVSHVAILSNGRMVEAAPLDELHEQVKRLRLPRELFERSASAWQRARVLESTTSGAAVTTVVRNVDALPQELLSNDNVETFDLGLEDIFLAVSDGASAQDPVEVPA